MWGLRMQELAVSKAISHLTHKLSRAGWLVSEQACFDEFEEVYKRLRDQKPSPQFRHSRFELTPENSFWIKAETNGKVVCVYAARLDLLGETPLSIWWRQQQRIYKKGGILGKAHAPGAALIKGRVAYSGEVYTAEGQRGGSMTADLVRVGHMLAWLKWHYDYMYGFIAPGLCAKGFAYQCGFLVQEPLGTDWDVVPGGVPADDDLVYTSGPQIRQLAKSINALSGSKPGLSI